MTPPAERFFVPVTVPSPSPGVTVRELVGRNVRRMCSEANATRTQVANAARQHGLHWTETWIAALERGQKALSAELLLVLPLVLATALSHRVALADLLIGDDDVALSDGVPVSAAHLRDVVTASPLRRSFSSTIAPTEVSPEAAEVARNAERLREIRRAGLGDIDIRVLAAAEAAASDIEEKLARRLRVPPVAVVAAAVSLWGRSLTEERAAQVAALGPRSRVDTRKATMVERDLKAQLAARLTEAASVVAASAAAASVVAGSVVAASTIASAAGATADSASPDPMGDAPGA